jgi:hypothetical protein
MLINRGNKRRRKRIEKLSQRLQFIITSKNWEKDFATEGISGNIVQYLNENLLMKWTAGLHANWLGAQKNINNIVLVT